MIIGLLDLSTQPIRDLCCDMYISDSDKVIRQNSTYLSHIFKLS